MPCEISVHIKFYGEYQLVADWWLCELGGNLTEYLMLPK